MQWCLCSFCLILSKNDIIILDQRINGHEHTNKGERPHV